MHNLDTISRRRFVSTGASLLAAGASLLIQPRVYGATPDSVHGSMQQATSREGGHHATADMGRCIQLCQECHAICTQTIAHCVKLGGRHIAHDHIQLLLDCAQMCVTNVDYMLRESAFHGRVCGLCSEMCRLCAESCEPVAADDPQVKQCIEMCRRCAESCEKMSSSAA